MSDYATATYRIVQLPGKKCHADSVHETFYCHLFVHVTRFNSLPTVVLPLLTAVFMLIYFLMIRKQGISSPLWRVYIIAICNQSFITWGRKNSILLLQIWIIKKNNKLIALRE